MLVQVCSCHKHRTSCIPSSKFLWQLL